MNTTIRIEKTRKTAATFRMADMKPLEVAIVATTQEEGHVVMRTANPCTFEVMDLTAPGENRCWTGSRSAQVRLVKATITVEVEEL